VFSATMNIIGDLNIWMGILLLTGIGLALLLSGKLLYMKLWETTGEKRMTIRFDGFTLGAFLFFISILSFYEDTFWAGVIHGLFISLALWIQRQRVPDKIRYLITFFAGAYLLVPYYTVLSELEVHPLWIREAILLPLIVLHVFLQFLLRGRWNQLMGYIQWGVLLVVSLLLVQDGLASSTVYDALILGSLSLISLLAGMWLRVKAYFFIGSGVLLLNVLLQTRPFWGNLPWWGYLLIVGTLLISVASFNEWNKQKVAKGEKTWIVKMVNKLMNLLKQWN
jgi:hypothetical protein